MPSTPPPARRRKAAAKGGPTAGEHPDFSRILGYMGEEGEEGSSPEPEVRPVGGKGAPREETPWEDVPDRDYIKHRTMKVQSDLKSPMLPTMLLGQNVPWGPLLICQRGLPYASQILTETTLQVVTSPIGKNTLAGCA